MERHELKSWPFQGCYNLHNKVDQRLYALQQEYQSPATDLCCNIDPLKLCARKRLQKLQLATFVKNSIYLREMVLE